MQYRIAAALAAALLACGCGGDLSGPSDVIGGTWRLISWTQTSGQAAVVNDPGRYTISFGNDERLSIKSDCNSCGGSYELNGSGLAVGALACTRAFCPSPSLDPAFAEAVGRARTVSVRDGMLVLQSEQGTLQFRP
jgi:heat shock protein HslJ